MLHRTVVAHAHVTAHVEHRIDGILIADCAVDGAAGWVVGSVVGDRTVDCAVSVDEWCVLLLLGWD